MGAPTLPPTRPQRAASEPVPSHSQASAPIVDPLVKDPERAPVNDVPNESPSSKQLNQPEVRTEATYAWPRLGDLGLPGCDNNEALEIVLQRRRMASMIRLAETIKDAQKVSSD